MADSFARVALARAYVPAHKRMTTAGLVDVEGYWREIGELSVLGGKMTDIDGGVRVRGAGHHWDITTLPDSKAVEVNEDNGISVSDFSDMSRALSHVTMQLRSARQIRDSYVPEEGRGTGTVPRYLKRMMKGIRVGGVPAQGSAAGYFSNVDRLVVKLAGKVRVSPHVRVSPKGKKINVEGYWRELLGRFNIEDTPKNRKTMMDLIEKQGPVNAEKTLASIHRNRVIVGGAPGTPRRLNQQQQREASKPTTPARPGHEWSYAGGKWMETQTEEAWAAEKKQKMDAVKRSSSPIPARVRFTLNETEHSGDIARYIDSLSEAEPQLKVVESGMVDEEEEYETGYVVLDVPDLTYFAKRFGFTDGGEMVGDQQILAKGDAAKKLAAETEAAQKRYRGFGFP